jgi:hypothetical protein
MQMMVQQPSEDWNGDNDAEPLDCSHRVLGFVTRNPPGQVAPDLDLAFTMNNRRILIGKLAKGR